MANPVISQITFEIEQIDCLFATYADLLNLINQRTPELVETTALAAVLHSFYTGVENIFFAIVKGFDGDIPSGAQWHRDLLTRVTKATPDRPQVLSEELALQLADYLAFRHFYRHSYSFILEWDEMEKLIVPLSQIWRQLKIELTAFLDMIMMREQEIS